MGRVLLIEDSESNQQIVLASLSQHEVDIAGDLATARAKIGTNEYDLVLLDVHLPDGDGFSFFVENQSRFDASSIPVIFLTAKGDTADKVMGFSLGADDYITKPIQLLEFRARIDARIRKRQVQGAGRVFRTDGFVFDLNQQTVVWGRPESASGDKQTKGAELQLTAFEFKLLLYLARHKDHVLSRETLLADVWGNSLNVVDRTIDTHMSHLRKKLAGTTLKIQSVYGAGYRLTAATAAAA